MKKLLLSTLFLFYLISGYAQCDPPATNLTHPFGWDHKIIAPDELYRGLFINMGTELEL